MVAEVDYFGGSSDILSSEELKTARFGVVTTAAATAPSINIGVPAKKVIMMYNGYGGSTGTNAKFLNFHPDTGEIVDGNYLWSVDKDGVITKNTQRYIIINGNTVSLNSAMASQATTYNCFLCTTE